MNLLLNGAKGVTFSLNPLNPAPLQAQNVDDEGLEQRASRWHQHELKQLRT